MSAEDLLPRLDEPEEPEPPLEPLPEAPAPERPALRPRQAAPRPGRGEERTFEESPSDPMVEARRQRLERRGEAEGRPPAPRPRYEPGAPRPPAPSVRAPAALPPPGAPPRRPAEQEEPHVLKSGIVGGMAYTLYSDGSIQAELPDGVVRFASLQELRDHVAQAQGR